MISYIYGCLKTLFFWTCYIQFYWLTASDLSHTAEFLFGNLVYSSFVGDKTKFLLCPMMNFKFNV